MKTADKDNVYKAYDEIVEWFDKARAKDLSLEAHYLELICSKIAEGSSILDVGCGTGEPLAKFFIEKGHKVIGVDASTKMIAICEERFPEQQWLVQDMRKLSLKSKFNVVIAWHSLFHLPYEEQRDTLNSLCSFVENKGLLAFTSGPEFGEVWSDNGGIQLYHASLSPDEYDQILDENGLRVIEHQVNDPKCGGATVWVAQKI